MTNINVSNEIENLRYRAQLQVLHTRIWFQLTESVLSNQDVHVGNMLWFWIKQKVQSLLVMLTAVMRSSRASILDVVSARWFHPGI